MSAIYVFNGDADGLCALQQLYLVEKFTTTRLVTGAKRRTELLAAVHAAEGEEVTVLDVSFSTNAPHVARLLSAGARVRYFDHHHAGELPVHPRLEAHIDLSPDVCTSTIVDRYLKGAARLWAAVGAFGDNLERTGRSLTALWGLCADDTAVLQRLGIALNYNAYGESEEDLLYHPLALHERLKRYADPRQFARAEPFFQELCAAYDEDLARVAALAPAAVSASGALYVLPDAPWARRVSGVFANLLVHQHPERAHAVAVPVSDGALSVSVRAPLERPQGAETLCRKFASGGGRARAAGINRLPASEIDRFAAELLEHFHA